MKNWITGISFISLLLLGTSAHASWTTCVGTSSADTITIGSYNGSTYCCVQTGTTNTWINTDSAPITSNPVIFGNAGNDHLTVVRTNFPVSVPCNGGVTLGGLSYGTHTMSLVGDGSDETITAGRDVIHGGDGPDTVWGDNKSCSATDSYGNDDTIDVYYGSGNSAAGCGGVDIVLDEGTNGSLYGGAGDGDCLGVVHSSVTAFDCDNESSSETTDTYASSSPWVTPSSGSGTCLGGAVPSCS